MEFLFKNVAGLQLQTFRPATLLKRDSNKSAFFWIMRNIWKQLFYRAPLPAASLFSLCVAFKNCNSTLNISKGVKNIFCVNRNVLHVFRNMLFIAKKVLKSNIKVKPKIYTVNFFLGKIWPFGYWYLSKVLYNSFMPNAKFIYPLKQLEKLTVSGV